MACPYTPYLCVILKRISGFLTSKENLFFAPSCWLMMARSLRKMVCPNSFRLITVTKQAL